MSRKNTWRILIPLLVMAVLALAITVALAGPSAQNPPHSEQGSPASPPSSAPGTDAASHEQPSFSSEPGEASPETTVGASAPVGPQPDEDGYQGEPTAADSASIPPSEEGPQEGPPDWEGLFTEPQPDEDAFYEHDAASPSGWSPFRYLHVAGTALRPRDNRVPWRYGGNGCVYAEDTSDLLNTHLQLPDGSLVEYVRIYYYDSVAATSCAWLTRYDDGAAYADVLTVCSTGSSGYGQALSNQSDHIVDNLAYSYVLNWRPYAPGPGLQLCGLRVAYRVQE